ncbi:MAG: aminopeptidase, partial [Lachnospiraceae bacterium]|nr:aminopeptidase [Lachnospiraceae bacterium]
MEDSIKETERWALAAERVHQIAANPEAEGAPGEYFQRTAVFLKMLLRMQERIESGEFACASLVELAEWIRELYGDIVGAANAHRLPTTDYAVLRLGKDYGQLLSFVYAELRGAIVYAFEGRLEEFLIHMELFLQLHAELEEGQLPPVEQLRDDVYWFVSDYCDVTVTARVREQVDPSLSFARDIIMEADLKDPRYLYYFGEYVSETELRMSAFLNSLPGEEIQRIASVFTEGYRIGFEVTGKDLSKKKTMNIRYCLGFERIIREAVKNFEEMGLQSILYRAAVSRVNMRENNKIGYYGTSPNRQYDYDHKGDAALFMDSAFVERRIGALKTAFEQYRELARGHAGPAVMEIFGEMPFIPEAKETALKLDEKQQKNQVRANSLAAQITNTYIPGEERSFTIIAFPVPDIGAQFEEIFRETVRINTLDYRTYQRIQQTIINVLDTGRAVQILGSGENRTNLTVALAKLQDPERETIFENCVADVNIPVGEVFTSPVLEGTNGVLHVGGVYLNGLFYQDLELHFRDGMVCDYCCRNYGNREENRR